MKITFRTDVPIAMTMAFEDCYEESLRLSLKDKQELLDDAIVVWLFVDGKLAGEMYGIPATGAIDEQIEDITEAEKDALYCYSSSVLPEFEGKGLGKILKAYWLGLVAANAYRLVVGHATSPVAIKVNEFFGARFKNKHEHWYGTEREAWFYHLPIGMQPDQYRQPNEWSCGVYALRYLLELNGAALVPSEQDLQTTDENGTSHDAITAYLSDQQINFTVHKLWPLAELPVPCLVNYQWDGDGHYGVITKTDGLVKIFNPGTGGFDLYPIGEFEKVWYSNRYGPQWALSINYGPARETS